MIGQTLTVRKQERPVIMKNALIVACAAALLGIIVAWLFFPQSVPYFRSIWETIGRPGFLGRLGWFTAFWGVVFFLAIRLGKRGPI